MSADKGQRMDYKAYREQIASGQVAAFTPRAWEQKVQALCNEAVSKYGNRKPPHPRTGYQEPAPDAGYWRDIDKADAKNNKRRIPGKLDFEYTRLYKPEGQPIPLALADALPRWKRELLLRIPGPFSFAIHLELKVGSGKPNQEQLRSIRLLSANPGAHPFVLYPHDLGFLRAILGI